MDQYGCLFIDATWRDMLAALIYTTQTKDRSSAITDVEGLFGGSDKCLVCFSVRSALDLFLSVMEFPRGSEILITAINIPDMVVIIEHHGLVVVPVDIDVDTLCPRYDDMAALVTTRTVAILTAHIYGRWTNMDAVIRIAQEHQLLVLEDCAESFSGLCDLGHPQTDLAFFSFGAIKYATAMGGGIVKVKDPRILSKMRTRLKTYPVFPESNYFERLFRYSIVMFLLNNPLVVSFGIRFMHFFAIDYRETIVSLLRGFPGNITKKIRFQPSTSLLRMMFRQIQQFDLKEHAWSKTNGDFVMKNLSDYLLIPGSKSDGLNYWLFPILVDNPKAWVTDLEKEGIEAYCGATQLNLVKPNIPTDCPAADEASTGTGGQAHSDMSTTPLAEAQHKTETADSKVSDNFGFINHENVQFYPHKAKFMIDHVLYLPVHKRIPLKDLELLCKGVMNVAQRRHPGLVNSKELVVNELKLQSKL